MLQRQLWTLVALLSLGILSPIYATYNDSSDSESESWESDIRLEALLAKYSADIIYFSRCPNIEHLGWHELRDIPLTRYLSRMHAPVRATVRRLVRMCRELRPSEWPTAQHINLPERPTQHVAPTLEPAQ